MDRDKPQTLIKVSQAYGLSRMNYLKKYDQSLKC